MIMESAHILYVCNFLGDLQGTDDLLALFPLPGFASFLCRELYQHQQQDQPFENHDCTPATHTDTLVSNYTFECNGGINLTITWVPPKHKT